MRSLTSILLVSLIASVTFTGLGCGPSAEPPRGKARRGALSTVNKWMIGTFTNQQQAAASPQEFHDTRLVQTPIWTFREDGPWLYVEQAHRGDETRPFLQRIYQLVIQPDGQIANEVYALPGNPLEYTAPWRGDGALGGLHPDDLVHRSGCTVIFAAEGSQRYVGAIKGTSCPSDLRGARYVRSEVTLESNQILVWDRGYDNQGRQVWGSTSGPYRFRRTSISAPE